MSVSKRLNEQIPAILKTARVPGLSIALIGFQTPAAARRLATIWRLNAGRLLTLLPSTTPNRRSSTRGHTPERGIERRPLS